MGKPHRPERYGETWNLGRIDATIREVEPIKGFVTLSGGWAWHLMTPRGHEELKHAHDHKDVDLFVPDYNFGVLVSLLKQHGFERCWTRFDGRDDSKDFYRYTKDVEVEGNPFQVIFDLFVGDPPQVPIEHPDLGAGFQVVAPATLLTYYGVKHSSGECFSVQIAKKLLARGESPVQHPEMADYGQFLATQSR